MSSFREEVGLQRKFIVTRFLVPTAPSHFQLSGIVSLRKVKYKVVELHHDKTVRRIGSFFSTLRMQNGEIIRLYHYSRIHM